MVCPKCGGKTTVIDGTTTDTKVFRRRKCKVCGELMYTTEINTGKTNEFSFEYCQKKYFYQEQAKKEKK